MASMNQRSMSAVGDLGLTQPVDLGGELLNETEEARKRRLAKTAAPASMAGIISPAVQALLGGGLVNGV